ncbi:MAG: hypothetical protein HMLKMBBP_01442 [Planctomycetes bacterium]|nr:hypothetical protein [Planctomycetota bacterium]
MRAGTVDAPAFAAELAGVKRPFVLDVRTREDFERGHVPGARNVPVHEMAKRPRDLPASKVARVLVIADPGKRAVAAANWLVLMGYVDVAVLEGGMAAWPGPVVTGPDEPPQAGPAGPVLRVIPS